MVDINRRWPSATPARLRLATAMHGYARWLERAAADAARRIGLHSTDLDCLQLLSAHDGLMSPKQINSALALSSGTGTALLDRLETAGYVRRKPNPDDRRGVLIELDSARAAAPLAFYTGMRDQVLALTDRFSEADLDRIAQFLEAVAALDLPAEPAPVRAALGPA